VLIDRVVGESLLRFTFASNAYNDRWLDKIAHDQRTIFIERAFALYTEVVVS